MSSTLLTSADMFPGSKMDFGEWANLSLLGKTKEKERKERHALGRKRISKIKR